jgi:hypothetical protein
MSRWKPGKVLLWAVLLVVAMGSGKMDRPVPSPAPPARIDTAAPLPDVICGDYFGDPVTYLFEEVRYNVEVPPFSLFGSGKAVRVEDLPPLPREFWPESDRRAQAPR